MANAAPVAKIIVVDTDLDQRKGYFRFCLEHVLPYQNNVAGNKVGKLITGYDQDRREDIKEGGPHHAALLARIQEKATKLNCNLLFWSSEQGKCRSAEKVKAEVNKVLPTNDYPTVVVLAGCNSNEFAFKFNAGKLPGQQIEFNGNKPSRKALFIGFDHQIHRLRDDVFMCEKPMEDFPMLTCKGEAISEEKAIADGLSNKQGEILQAARDSTNEKVQCCIDRTEGFPYFFVEEFKGKRNCGKLDWTKLEERVANILRKKDARDTITLDDSSIRWSEDTQKCKSIDGGNPNPCEIVNDFPPNKWNSYDAKFTNDEKKWGRLMATLKTDKENYGSSASNFNSILSTIPLDKQRELINTKQKDGHSILLRILVDRNLGLQPEKKRELVLKLLDLGASRSISKDKDEYKKGFERSVTEILFEEYPKILNMNDLYEKNISLETDESFQRKKEFTKQESENKSKQKQVQSVYMDLQAKFVIYVQDILKDIYKNSRKTSTDKIELLRRFTILFFSDKTDDFLNTFKQVGGAARANQYDNATEILNVLKSKTGDKTNYDLLRQSMITDNRDPKNIFPLKENEATTSPPSGGKRLTRKRKFSKRSSTGKKRRATNAK